ncbi:hypothetical protein L596_017144 [Steinernema carpocapsae]|uniref:Abnormal cell migration protein 18-like fibronectin type I domain-containing protein n=1 Tax=Steinernema carpocapsae TaxID=34508 RepID=A0A4U5N1G6_STECR|nr:hypothetical protein L596_017144 [Steinernema carpocapsae]
MIVGGFKRFAPETTTTLLIVFVLVASVGQTKAQNSFVLVPHGHGPNDASRVVIPHVMDGPQPPFPCILAESGTHEHGQTFTKGNFHYKCNNGTSEVIACVSDDSSVIQIGRTFIRNGVKHKCNVNGDTVTYEQESTCFENGIHYNIGESFRNGSFKLICRQNGIGIDGCYAQNASDIVIPLGQIQVIGNYRHNCEILERGRVRYAVNLIGCRKGNEIFNEGQIWTDKHIRYQCLGDGALKVLGCIDDGGFFIDLGRDILMNGVVHRCYRINHTTFYHRFHCEAGTLHECVNSAAAATARSRAMIFKS